MNRSRQRPRIAAALFGIAALSISPAYAAGSHSGGHDQQTTGQMSGGHMMSGDHMRDDHGHSLGFGAPGKASEVDRTVEIVMKDTYYEPETVSVKAGETVRFRVANKGELVHEFNIGTATMHAEHQKEMMLMVDHGVLEPDKIHYDRMKMDMGGGKTMEHDDPNSVLLEPGKSGEIVWKFTKAADLEFACNIPGHYDAGMMGHIRFK